jgi:hypothetical protein
MNGLDDHDFELVRDFSHERRDLLHQTINARFIASL